jgi:hypothetical protein
MLFRPGFYLIITFTPRTTRPPRATPKAPAQQVTAHMTEQPDPTQGSPLTPTQATLIDYARRDLETSRATDLAQLDDADLILMIERLRKRLDDTLQVIDETLRT